MLPVLLALLVGNVDPPSIVAVRTKVRPAVDGRLDESDWGRAQPSSAFTQKYPEEGVPPSERTTIRVLYDDNALYFGITCEQLRSPINARLSRRDQEVESDHVTIDLDTRGDGKSAFHFEVSAAGVLVDALRFDEQISDEGDLLFDWDENWSAATTTSTSGWVVEIEIPLRTLRFEREEHAMWGLQVRRYISAVEEEDEWAFIPRDVAGEMLHYGRLSFDGKLEPPGSVELRPFVLGQVRHREKSDDALATGTDWRGSLGLDAKLHISQDMTLDATLNPDFGQVEADPAVLNLTTVEILFPEKRPFFLEGLDAFSTPLRVLYTRRIGRTPPPPELRVDSTYDDKLVDRPDRVPIYGAAKLVGRPTRGLTVAALSAVTGRENVGVQLADGSRTAFVTDPTTYFQALRLKYDVTEHATIGAIATAVARFEDRNAYPPAETASGQRQLCSEQLSEPISEADRVATESVPKGSRCFHDAYAAGIDWRWRSASGAYVASAQGLGTFVKNGPDRTLLDGTVVRSGDLAPGGTARISKEGGNWLFDLRYDGFAPKFELNDLGFLRRQNLHHFLASGSYRETTSNTLLREHRTKLSVSYRRNFDGLLLANGYTVHHSGRIREVMDYFVAAHYRAAHFDDREIGNGVALERAGRVGFEVEMSTDPRRRVVGEVLARTQRVFNGVRVDVEGRLSLKVFGQLDLELSPRGIYADGEPRHVPLTEGPMAGSFLFGKQRASALGVTLRANYAFTPNLSLQAYAQLFLEYVAYHDFQYYSGTKKALQLTDLVATTAPAAMTSIEEGTLNGNVVLRWEYLPGSTLLAVYTHAQFAALTYAPGSEDGPALRLRPLGHGGATDIFLIKLSYLWTL